MPASHRAVEDARRRAHRRAGDAGGGELSGQQHGGHADAGCGAAAGQHRVVRRARRLRGRNGPVWGRCGRAENGVPAACPGAASRPASPGQLSMASASPGRPRRPARRRACRGSAGPAVPVGGGADVGVRDRAPGRSSRWRPGGARAGSVAVGRVMQQRRVASSARPRDSSSNVRCQAAPNERLWWAGVRPGAVVPTCRTTAEGACRIAAAGGAGRGRAAGRRRRSSQREHDRVAGDPLPLVGVHGGDAPPAAFQPGDRRCRSGGRRRRRGRGAGHGARAARASRRGGSTRRRRCPCRRSPRRRPAPGPAAPPRTGPGR